MNPRMRARIEARLLAWTQLKELPVKEAARDRSRPGTASRQDSKQARETIVKQATGKASEKAAGELKPQGPRGVAYDKATKIAARHAKRFLWGDDQAGWVSDWI